MAQRWATLAAVLAAALAGLIAPVVLGAAPQAQARTQAQAQTRPQAQAQVQALTQARTQAQAPARTQAQAQAPAQARTAPAGRVVVIGVPGLRWNDLGPRRTPALWKMTGQGAGGVLSVRTTREITCPMDGWLTLSAGQRARLAHGNCALPPEPTRAQPPADGPNAQPDPGAYAAGFAAIRYDNQRTAYEAKVGLLGDAVHAAGGCTTAVGPGAAFGAADGTGRVDTYAPAVDKAAAADWSKCALTVVEVDDVFRTYITAGVDAKGAQVPVSQATRAAAATAADRRVAQVLAAVPQGTTVLVAGLSDTVTAPHLHVALVTGAPFGAGYLTANSTRQPGLVTLTDVTATVVDLLKLPRQDGAIGAPWRFSPSDDAAAEKARTLNDEDVAAQAIRRMHVVFDFVLFGGQLLVYVLATLALRRRWGSAAVRRRILGGTRVVALAGAAALVSTILANLVPWWHFAHPVVALVCSVAASMLVVTALALGGPWRRSVIAPGLVIAALTALVLGLDVITGSRLQMNAFMGYNAIVAGRFYGFGNIAFSLFAVSSLLSAAWLAERPLRAGRRRLAVAIVLAVGVMTVAIDGWPSWGADFGGVLAIVPAVAVLTLMVAGKRVSVVRIGLFCLAGAVIVLTISFVDSLRADPTHLGRFWDQLVSGEAGGVIARKFQAMLRSLGYAPFTVALLGALGFLFFVLARPVKWRAALLTQAYARAKTLRPALLSVLTVAIVGMLVNDSGVVIPAMVLSLAVPLTLAASVRAQELAGEPAETPPQERSAAQSASTG